jgi:hypothetical protein
MKRPRSLAPQRTAREWTVRALLASMAALFGYLGVAHSLALATMTADPVWAHALAPYDGRVTGRLALQRLSEKQNVASTEAIGRWARLALRQDPTVIDAVVTLGLQAQLRGDLPSARRLFAYAELLSRRDLKTQLWAIEDTVARGDVPQALHHYDIALRTSMKAPELLFPVLADAIADPVIRTNLISILAAKPIWGTGFVVYIVSKGQDPRLTAALFTGLHRAGVSLPQDVTAALINNLVAIDEVDDAWRFYATIRSGAKRSRSRDPHFSVAMTTPALFDWTPINDAGISTSIQPSANGIFDFAVSPSVGGPMLTQMQALPSGLYYLRGRSVGLDQPERSLPYWLLACHNGRELGRVTVTRSAQAGGNFQGQVRVPSDCSAQTLSLIARPSDAVSGVTGQIDLVQLVPVPGGQ